jgi:hypothetical protein
MAESSNPQEAARTSVPADFEQWKDDLLLRESLVSEPKTKLISSKVPLSEAACRFLRKGFDLSPEEFRCLENVVLGRPCGRCPCRDSKVLADRSLVNVNVDRQGRRSCTPTEIAAFVYETAVMILQAVSKPE